jgi:hypothetical protein
MLIFDIKSYRLNILECYLLKKVENIYLDAGYSFQRWPEIYFGNFVDFPSAKINESKNEFLDDELYFYNIDYLGLYVYSSTTEGHIRIFRDRIKFCASKIANNLKLDANDVMNDLLTIVLIHEIGHWLTHSCHIKNNRIRLRGFSSQEKIIKESLAQLTVFWSFMKIKNKEVNRLKVVFEYLVDRQSYPYKAFRELGKKQTYVKTLLKRYGYIADDHIFNFGYDFNYFLNGDIVFKKKANISE